MSFLLERSCTNFMVVLLENPALASVIAFHMLALNSRRPYVTATIHRWMSVNNALKALLSCVSNIIHDIFFINIFLYVLIVVVLVLVLVEVSVAVSLKRTLSLRASIVVLLSGVLDIVRKASTTGISHIACVWSHLCLTRVFELLAAVLFFLSQLFRSFDLVLLLRCPIIDLLGCFWISGIRSSPYCWISPIAVAIRFKTSHCWRT